MRVIFINEMNVKIDMKRHFRDMIWRKNDEKLYSDCITYRKRHSKVDMMFWDAFRMGKINSRFFFDLEARKHINSTVYRDQVLIESLQDFWWEAFEDITKSVILENNASSHKKIYISIQKELEMMIYQYSPNSLDLNPIENIWCHMKKKIAKDYAHIISQVEMMRMI